MVEQCEVVWKAIRAPFLSLIHWFLVFFRWTSLVVQILFQDIYIAILLPFLTCSKSFDNYYWVIAFIFILTLNPKRDMISKALQNFILKYIIWLIFHRLFYKQFPANFFLSNEANYILNKERYNVVVCSFRGYFWYLSLSTTWDAVWF